MKVEDLNLPVLPARHEWFLETFQNNELQAYPPNSRLVMTVKKRHNFLGIPVRVRPVSYPAYVIRAGASPEFMQATARQILDDHERWLSHHPTG